VKTIVLAGEPKSTQTIGVSACNGRFPPAMAAGVAFFAARYAYSAAMAKVDFDREMARHAKTASSSLLRSIFRSAWI
jgi:hypothetical protein